jgi:N-acylneuraminate cytidylyltransferase
MTCYAIIPARGGSKGIPGKNLTLIGGRWFVARAVEAARAATGVDQVWVSSDNALILAEAERYGAHALLRPEHLSGDTASSESALLHALDEFDKSGARPEVIVFLQCTSPLMLAKDIDGVLEKMAIAGADCAFSASQFHGFLWRPEPDGGVSTLGHELSRRPRRQEREPQYLENGAIYAMRTEGFLRAKHRFFGRVAAYLMPPERSIDVDEPHDLDVAGALARRLEAQEAATLLPNPVEALALDFDGVMTDDGVWVEEGGREGVRVTRADGLGVARLRELGLPIVVISKERNPVVAARCQKLQLECLQAVDAKDEALAAWAQRKGVDLAGVVYVGNDVNDLPAFSRAGCAAAPADAHPSVLSAARVVLRAQGGHGAVREICDLISAQLEARRAEGDQPR